MISTPGTRFSVVSCSHATRNKQSYVLKETMLCNAGYGCYNLFTTSGSVCHVYECCIELEEQTVEGVIESAGVDPISTFFKEP
jgi:hypothetical protein